MAKACWKPRAGGVPLRRLGRNGPCREDRVEMPQCQMQHRIAWPGLSANEKLEGGVLACVAVDRGKVLLWQTPA